MNEIKFDPTLHFLLFLRNRKKTVFDFFKEKNVKSYFFFGFARAALREGLRAIGLGSHGCSILVPSYICNAIIHPLRELGLKIVFYNTLLNMEPDVHDLEKRIDKTTRAILVVNYFGFSSKIDEVKEIANERNLYIIEDNAHSFLSENDSELLGTRGDMGISSLRKTFPVPDGAVLYIKEQLLVKLKNQNIYSNTYNATMIDTYRRFLFLLVSNYDFTNRSLYLAKKLSNLINSNDDNKFNGFISPLSLKIINNSDFDEIANRRRKNYLLYLRKFSEIEGIELVFEKLDDGIVPWVFPVVVRDPKKVKRSLSELKIPTSTWPDLPAEIYTEPSFRSSRFLAEHLITMPVHQGIQSNLLAKVLDID